MLCFLDEFDKIQGSHPKLFKWPSGSVGERKLIDIGNGNKAEMETKSIKPALFQIDHFLSSQECKDLIKLAEKSDLGNSLDDDRREKEKTRREEAHLPAKFLDFDYLDENKNGRIDLLEEVQSFAYKFNSIYLNEFEVTEIFKIFKIEVTTYRDESFITKHEFMRLDLPYFFDYLNTLKDTHPLHSERHYEYSKIHPLSSNNEPILTTLFEKIKTTTKIDHEILKGMEPIEIIRYVPYGHYFTHFESDDKGKKKDLPCCHHSSSKFKSCRKCRFLNLLIYLNDEGGPGETVFPVADDANYSYEKFIDKSDHDLTNLIHHCEKSKLIITPKTGTALMWYNHDISPEGLLGDHDHYSLFGECNIYFNEKWVAYVRIVASEKKELIHKSIHRPDYDTTREFDAKEDSKSEL